MLVTDVGGLKEIVQHQKCGYVVKPDPKDIADAIVDYFDNNRKKAFTEGVRKEKEKFSWNKMTDSITEVFYRCLLKQLIKALVITIKPNLFCLGRSVHIYFIFNQILVSFRGIPVNKFSQETGKKEN